MTRKYVIWIACLLLFLLLPHLSSAYDIAVLKSADIKPYNEALEGFKSSCDCRIIDLSHSESEQSNISDELAGGNAQGIFAIGMDALGKVSGSSELPVVYTMIPAIKPIGSYKKNLAGVSMNASPEKYLVSLIELFPWAKRVGLVYDPRNSEAFVQDAQRYAQSRGIELIAKRAGRPGEAPSLIEAMKGKIDVFWMIPDPTVIGQETMKFLLLFSFQTNIPVFTFSKKYVEMGAVAGLNITPYDMGVQAGELMKRLASEQNVRASMRVDPRRASLIINTKIARKMGIKIRDEVSRKAENVN